MFSWVLATFLSCGTAACPMQPLQSPRRESPGSFLPSVPAREEIFAKAGIKSHLDQLKADHMDRDVLYIKAKSKSAEALITLYSWMTIDQAKRLREAIDCEESIPGGS